MPSPISVLLNAILSATDTLTTPSPTVFSRNLNNPNLAVATTFFADMYFQANSGGSSVPLPGGGPSFVGYVKNNDVATNLTVSWIAVGAAASTFVMVPGGVWIYFQPTEGAGGFTSLTLTAAAGTINTEVFAAR